MKKLLVVSLLLAGFALQACTPCAIASKNPDKFFKQGMPVSVGAPVESVATVCECKEGIPPLVATAGYANQNCDPNYQFSFNIFTLDPITNTLTEVFHDNPSPYLYSVNPAALVVLLLGL